MRKVTLLLISVLLSIGVTKAQNLTENHSFLCRFHLDLGFGMNFNEHVAINTGAVINRRWINLHSSLGYRGKYFNVEAAFNRPVSNILPSLKIWRQLDLSGSINILPPFNGWKGGRCFFGPTILYGKTSGFESVVVDESIHLQNPVSGVGIIFSCKIKDEHQLVLSYRRMKFAEDSPNANPGTTYRYTHVTNTITASFSISSAIFRKKKANP